MALTTTITKKSVTLVSDGKYTMVDRDFSQTFKPGMAFPMPPIKGWYSIRNLRLRKTRLLKLWLTLQFWPQPVIWFSILNTTILLTSNRNRAKRKLS